MLRRDRLDGRMFDRDHVEDAAREQAALGRVLHDGQTPVGAHSPPFGMALEVAQHRVDASEVPRGAGFVAGQARGEIGVQRDHPAGAGDRGVGGRLDISGAGDHDPGGRAVGDPNGGVAPGVHRAQKAGIGVDPRGTAGASAFGAGGLNRDARPHPLPGGQNGSVTRERHAAASGDLDDGRGSRRGLHAGRDTVGKFAFQDDAGEARVQCAACGTGRVVRRSGDARQRHKPAFPGRRGEIRGPGLEHQAIDGAAIEKFERPGVGPRPAGGHPIGRR